jgi:phosphate transport system substrate-binding protein
VARPPARPAPPPEPVDLEPEPELLAPRTKSTAVTPPLTSRSRPPATGPRTGGPKTAGPKTARPAGAPAAPPPAGKKGPRLFLVLVGLLALAAVGGVVAVVVIATGGQTTPTKPQIVYVDKERDGPAPKPGPGDARNPDAGKPPAPTGDGPKPPDKTPDPAPAAGVTIHGSGSTFIGPAMEHWTELYKKKTGVNIEYSGIGSTGGVSNMIEKVLGADFGCTDAFMTPAQLEQAKGLHGEVVHVPLALGAVVAAYNLPNLKDNKLTLTGDVLALIYKGEITRWNHETIKTLNPTVAADLPDEKIVVIRRSDGSGTTAIWTEYLNDSSDGRWGKDLVGTKITWPKVDGAEDVAKSGGVAGAVAKKTGALGYVELSIALERNLKFAQIKTKGSRKAVDATLDSITAAANNASTQSDPSDFKYNLINCPGDESYPICGMTWLVLYADQSPSKKRGKELVKFLKWAVTDGQAQLKNLKYATLPEPLVKKVLAKLDTIRTSE